MAEDFSRSLVDTVLSPLGSSISGLFPDALSLWWDDLAEAPQQGSAALQGSRPTVHHIGSPRKRRVKAYFPAGCADNEEKRLSGVKRKFVSPQSGFKRKVKLVSSQFGEDAGRRVKSAAGQPDQAHRFSVTSRLARFVAHRGERAVLETCFSCWATQTTTSRQVRLAKGHLAVNASEQLFRLRSVIRGVEDQLMLQRACLEWRNVISIAAQAKPQDSFAGQTCSKKSIVPEAFQGSKKTQIDQVLTYRRLSRGGC